MRYVAAALTDVGRKRQENEDSFCLVPELGLYVVADGMGGHAAGEVASRLAVETIQEWMGKYLTDPSAAVADAGAESVSHEASFLLSSIQFANRIIFDAAKARREYAGMGTTIVAALTRDDTVVLAHVGDSRIYRIRDGQISQVTRDHSFVQHQVDRGIMSVEEAQQSQYRHMITRALGLKERVEVDLTEERAVAGDLLLLCSDGLSDLLHDEEILDTLREPGADLDRVCRVLIDRANANGGDDNITALVIQALNGPETRRGSDRWLQGVSTPGRRGVVGWLKRVLGA
jgi:protein phosphatase